MYFIRKTSSKYKIHTESNVKIPSDDRLAAGTSAVNGSSVGAAAVIYATDGSLAAEHDETEEVRPRAFKPEPSNMVVVDMENDDQDKWTNHEDSAPYRKRRPEDTLQDSLLDPL
jgi:hypothetical protein